MSDVAAGVLIGFALSACVQLMFDLFVAPAIRGWRRRRGWACVACGAAPKGDVKDG